VKCVYLPCSLDVYTYIPWYKTLMLLFMYLDVRNDGLSIYTIILCYPCDMPKYVHSDIFRHITWTAQYYCYYSIIPSILYANRCDYLPIFILSMHFKSPKTFRVIITIILCCPCYMPKYVRMDIFWHITWITQYYCINRQPIIPYV
jgi:hypothetical protein